MERIGIAAVENALSAAAVKRRVGDALGTTAVAINYYELAPGDSFGYAYHRHPDQEEVFVVESGTVTFETEGGPVAVGPDEAIRFAPGEFQRGVNRGDERVSALAIGAPRDTDEAEKLRRCPDCRERTLQTIELAADGDAIITRCLDCDAVTGRFVHGEVDAGGEP